MQKHESEIAPALKWPFPLKQNGLAKFVGPLRGAVIGFRGQR
jgi:hypothetical protein